MDKLILENFRTYKERTEIDFAPITILTGKNNSGKSTILKAILLLSDYLNSENQLIIEFDGPSGHKHKIDCIKNAITWGNEDISESFEIAFEKDGFLFSFIIGDYGVGGLFSAQFIHLVSNTKMSFDRLSRSHFSFQIDTFFMDSLNTKSDDQIDTEIDVINARKIKYELEIENVQNRINQILKITDEEPKSNIAKKELREKIEKLSKTEMDEYSLLIDNKNTLIRNLKELNKKINDFKNLKINTRFSKNIQFKKEISIDDINKKQFNLISFIQPLLFEYYRSDEFKGDTGLDTPNSLMKLFTFFRELNEILLFKAHHLGPNRTHQARLYLNQNREIEINEIMSVYAHNTPPPGSRAKEFLIKWMKEFEIGIDIQVENIQATASFIKIFEEGRKEPVNLTDKGFGAGQILTILMKICNEVAVNNVDENITEKKSNSSIIMIEEPETNLHPYLQSRLADMFYDAHKQFGIRFILETHSEYLIRKTQSIVNKTQDMEIFKVFYVDNSKGIHVMRYRDDGRFIDEFGPGFFDESSNLAFELF